MTSVFTFLAKTEASKAASKRSAGHASSMAWSVWSVFRQEAMGFWKKSRRNTQEITGKNRETRKMENTEDQKPSPSQCKLQGDFEPLCRPSSFPLAPQIRLQRSHQRVSKKKGIVVFLISPFGHETVEKKRARCMALLNACTAGCKRLMTRSRKSCVGCAGIRGEGDPINKRCKERSMKAALTLVRPPCWAWMNSLAASWA